MKRKYIYIPVLCCIALTLCSAGFNDLFVQRQTEKGWLFHTFSQNMSSIDKKSKDLKYDFTYLQQTDSVTLLATIVSQTAFTPDSLHISCCGKNYAVPTELVYLTPAKNKFDIRIKADLPFDIWEDLYTCTNPYTLYYKMKNGNQTEILSFGYNSKKWKSIREKTFLIISSVKINTGKQ